MAVVCTRQCTWFKNPNVVTSNGRELRLPTKKSSIEDQICCLMKAIQDAYVGKLDIGCIDHWTFRKRIGEWGVQTITLATVSAKVQNVSVHDLHIHNSEPDYHSNELSGIIVAIRRVDLVRCDVAYPRFFYEAILRRYQTRGVPFPGLATYGCNLPNAHSGINGYCISDRRPYAAPIFERPTSDYHLLAPDLVEKMYRFKCVTIIFYRVNDVPIKQQGLENYAANRVSSSTDDHLSYFFDGITQVIDEFGDVRETKFKAQICLHGGCLTFRFTSDLSTCDSFLECEGK